MKTENSKYLEGGIRIVDLARMPEGSSCIYRLKHFDVELRRAAMRVVGAAFTHSNAQCSQTQYSAIDSATNTRVQFFLEVTVTRQGVERKPRGRKAKGASK